MFIRGLLKEEKGEKEEVFPHPRHSDASKNQERTIEKEDIFWPQP